jgi:hypothetical protein
MHPLARYLHARWHGQLPIGQLFWWDTLVVGTLINAWGAMLGLILLAQDFGTAAWLAVFLALLPYNLFLVTSIWRHLQSTLAMRTAALAWLSAGLLV